MRVEQTQGKVEKRIRGVGIERRKVDGKS